jgi:hypothetical protein
VAQESLISYINTRKRFFMSQTAIDGMSTMHAIECGNCKKVLYECDVQEGAVYETPLDFDDISACPDCGHLMVCGNYSRIEDDEPFPPFPED